MKLGVLPLQGFLNFGGFPVNVAEQELQFNKFAAKITYGRDNVTAQALIACFNCCSQQRPTRIYSVQHFCNIKTQLLRILIFRRQCLQ